MIMHHDILRGAEPTMPGTRKAIEYVQKYGPKPPLDIEGSAEFDVRDDEVSSDTIDAVDLRHSELEMHKNAYKEFRRNLVRLQEQVANHNLKTEGKKGRYANDVDQEREEQRLVANAHVLLAEASGLLVTRGFPDDLRREVEKDRLTLAEEIIEQF